MLLVLTVSALPGAAITVWSHFDRPLRGLTIAVDPGHGGIDDGTRAGGRHLEKDVNLQLSFALRDALERLGAQVIMTRETDISLSKQDKVYPGRHREDLARRVEIIHENNADLFVSVHCNACPEYPGARGAIVYYAKVSPISKQMAESVQDRLNSMNLSSFGATVRPHAAVGADYFVLRNTRGPGILLEAGYLSNWIDLRLLLSKQFQKSLAHSVSMGLADWRRLPEPESEPEHEGSLAVLIKPSLALTTWTDWLMSEVPLTFVLDAGDSRAMGAAEKIRASGHDAILLQRDNSGEATLGALYYQDADSLAAVPHMLLRDLLAVPAISMQDIFEGHTHASVITARNQGRATLLVELSNHTGLSTPNGFLALLKQTAIEQRVQLVYASDLLFPVGHHGP